MQPGERGQCPLGGSFAALQSGHVTVRVQRRTLFGRQAFRGAVASLDQASLGAAAPYAGAVAEQVRRLGGAEQRAADDAVPVVASESGGGFARPRDTGVVERDVGVALHAVEPVPLGFGVADEAQSGQHRTALGGRRSAAANAAPMAAHWVSRSWCRSA